jgi:hypothetical protein
VLPDREAAGVDRTGPRIGCGGLGVRRGGRARRKEIAARLQIRRTPSRTTQVDLRQDRGEQQTGAGRHHPSGAVPAAGDGRPAARALRLLHLIGHRVPRHTHGAAIAPSAPRQSLSAQSDHTADEAPLTAPDQARGVHGQAIGFALAPEPSTSSGEAGWSDDGHLRRGLASSFHARVGPLSEDRSGDRLGDRQPVTESTRKCS